MHKIRTCLVEQLAAELAIHLDRQRKVAHQLNDLRHMVIVLVEDFPLALRIKEVFRCQKLEDLQNRQKRDMSVVYLNAHNSKHKQRQTIWTINAKTAHE